MILTLYTNKSDSNVVDKNLTQVIQLEGTLRESTSIVNPVFTVAMESPSNVNYIYCPAFNRYYYVTDVVSVVTGLWAFSCHVDVLMSYRANIRSLSAIIARQENEYNLYLDDDQLITTCKRQYWTKAFETRVVPPSGTNDLSFIITIAGGGGSSS